MLYEAGDIAGVVEKIKGIKTSNPGNIMAQSFDEAYSYCLLIGEARIESND